MRAAPIHDSADTLIWNTKTFQINQDAFPTKRSTENSLRYILPVIAEPCKTIYKNVKIWVHDGIPFFTLIYYCLT